MFPLVSALVKLSFLARECGLSSALCVQVRFTRRESLGHGITNFSADSLYHIPPWARPRPSSRWTPWGGAGSSLAHPRPRRDTGLFQPAAQGRRLSLGLRPLVTSRCLLCPQTDTSDPEKVVSAFLKVSSVFKDEAPVRTAVQDAVGNAGWVGRGWLCLLAASGFMTFRVAGAPCSSSNV